ncbi:uncharacterized protein LOC131381349 [Hylobates moloch]|uniref:uncharacterized protein LOC131381349 n=1 Tax=Hylobates moloch TaxID=81572 RepID=UPI0026766C1A|nr:uncharacterized protein LOC131381349 [Hylobates moloch]
MPIAEAFYDAHRRGILEKSPSPKGVDIRAASESGSVERTSSLLSSHPWDLQCCSTDLTGKTAVVTGANSSIGKVVSQDLARCGAQVILTCQSRECGQQALAEIQAASNSNCFLLGEVDLGSITSIRSFARRLLQENPEIHLLDSPRHLPQRAWISPLSLTMLGPFCSQIYSKQTAIDFIHWRACPETSRNRNDCECCGAWSCIHGDYEAFLLAMPLPLLACQLLHDGGWGKELVWPRGVGQSSTSQCVPAGQSLPGMTSFSLLPPNRISNKV